MASSRGEAATSTRPFLHPAEPCPHPSEVPADQPGQRTTLRPGCVPAQGERRPGNPGKTGGGPGGDGLPVLDDGPCREGGRGRLACRGNNSSLSTLHSRSRCAPGAPGGIACGTHTGRRRLFGVPRRRFGLRGGLLRILPGAFADGSGLGGGSARGPIVGGLRVLFVLCSHGTRVAPRSRVKRLADIRPTSPLSIGSSTGPQDRLS